MSWRNEDLILKECELLFYQPFDILVLFSSSKVAKRLPSPKIDLDELSKRECPELSPTDKKGIILTSMPIDQSDKKYTRINCKNDVEPIIEVEWPNNVNGLIAKSIEEHHECKMVEFMRKKV